MSIYTFFRIVALLEGFSYLALLLIAMPLKYIWQIEEFVQNIGMAHGILFILYIVMALFLYKHKPWSQKELIIVLVGSIVPFGAFYVDHKFLKNNLKNQS